MRIAVQDANVLIDLELACLFDLWLQLGIETYTTDLILGELEDGGHRQALAYFRSGRMISHGLSFAELEQVSELEREIGSKAKFNDCSVLFLAMKLNAMLISGDKALRKAGKDRSVEVHGTLWIIDQLVSGKVMTGEIAAAKLEYLLSLERYLPASECQILMKKWKQS